MNTCDGHAMLMVVKSSHSAHRPHANLAACHTHLYSVKGILRRHSYPGPQLLSSFTGSNFRHLQDTSRDFRGLRQAFRKQFAGGRGNGSKQWTAKQCAAGAHADGLTSSAAAASVTRRDASARARSRTWTCKTVKSASR